MPDDDKKDDKKTDAGAPDPLKELEAAKARLAELEAENTKLKAKPPEDLDLKEKARLERESKDKKGDDVRTLEKALTFNMQSADFLKKNESLLPKDVAEIFKLAEKENYSSAIEKGDAIKSGIIQSFFSVQSNVDLLTPGLKSSLDDYLKLTKNGKQEKAQHVYDTVFEPAFEMLKRIKKAEALNKGYGSTDDVDTAYRNRLMGQSKKHYLGEKSNGS